MSDTVDGPIGGMTEEYDVFAADMLDALLELFDSQKERFETDAVQIMA